MYSFTRVVVQVTFSTLPRVELPGANNIIVPPGMNHLLFQYPTSGRTAWSTTLETFSQQLRLLSVPYLGSNCLELLGPGRVNTCSNLSVPYLGSNCLEESHITCGANVCRFQYPTSGRTAWSDV